MTPSIYVIYSRLEAQQLVLFHGPQHGRHIKTRGVEVEKIGVRKGATHICCSDIL